MQGFFQKPNKIDKIDSVEHEFYKIKNISLRVTNNYDPVCPEGPLDPLRGLIKLTG